MTGPTQNFISTNQSSARNTTKNAAVDLLATPINFSKLFTVFENDRKSHIQHCKRSELRLHYDKSSLKMPKIVHFGEFLKIWSLQSNSLNRQINLNWTKIGGKCQNFKIFKWDILGYFQTMWVSKSQKLAARLLFCLIDKKRSHEKSP